MGLDNNISGKGEEVSFNRRPLAEVVNLVDANSEVTRAELGIPTREEVEKEIDPRLVCIMGTPYLTPEKLEEKIEGKKVILFVAYATGTLSDELVPVLKRRMEAGVPVIVLSDNAGENYGIRGVKYSAGSELYESGALALQTVNVKHYQRVKQAIILALNEGLSGADFVKYMQKNFCLQEGEELSPAEWDTEEGVDRIRASTLQIFQRSGFIGKELESKMDDWEFGDHRTGWKKRKN